MSVEQSSQGSTALLQSKATYSELGFAFIGLGSIWNFKWTDGILPGKSRKPNVRQNCVQCDTDIWLKWRL